MWSPRGGEDPLAGIKYLGSFLGSSWWGNCRCTLDPRIPPPPDPIVPPPPWAGGGAGGKLAEGPAKSSALSDPMTVGTWLPEDFPDHRTAGKPPSPPAPSPLAPREEPGPA